MWVARDVVSDGSRRLGSRIEEKKSGHKVTWTCFKDADICLNRWARKRRKNFAANREEVKKTTKKS